MRELLLNSWNKANLLTIFLWPLSLVYRALFCLRTQLFRLGLLSSYTAPVPVIVVGNLTVGGTGKTPLVIYLVECLRELGFKPGVISRGYGGEAQNYPMLVAADTPASMAGDEPALIVRRTGVPMAVGSNRAASIDLLLSQYPIDIVISDDGLQHLALNRDIEVCLMDHTSPQNNTQLLPAGPYREALSRLSSVDFIVRHGAALADNADRAREFAMQLEPSQPQALSPTTQPFDTIRPIHAVAGIGNPERFFNTCRELGLDIKPHAFVDHHRFVEADLQFDDELAVLMTEKDAVKCEAFANALHWYLPVDAKLTEGFEAALADKIQYAQNARAVEIN